MGALAPTTRGFDRRADLRSDRDRVAVWLLAFVLVVYLGLSGGGYDTILRSEVGVLAWWGILLGALAGVLPRARLSGAAWVALALFGAFLAWTRMATSWSASEQSTLLEAARVSTYLGIFALALCVISRGTARALLSGVASAVGFIAGLAVLYRIAPSFFPADTAARFYNVSSLQWPFGYADAVGEFVVLGVPLLLVVAVSARTVAGRLAAATGGALALVCLAMSASRGGVLAGAVGLITLGLLGPRHTWLVAPSGRMARRLVLSALAGVVLIAILTGAVHRLWVHFQRPNIGGQFSLSSGHRYQYWQAAGHAFVSAPWHGIGPGTFQFYWAGHNSLHEFVLNAHSVYFETLAEAGILGLLLIAGMFLTVLIAGSRGALRMDGSMRLTVAGATAGFAAFCAAAGFDWVWQIGVVPVVALVLAAVALNSGEHARTGPRRRTRAVLAVAAVPALWAIILPLVTTVEVRTSEREAAHGDYRAALDDAASAHRLDPGAAAPWLQRALILEQLREPAVAQVALGRAESRDPLNWRIWLVASRVATEAGQPRAALAHYLRARSLNPTSPLFTETARLIPIAETPLSALVVPPGKAGANQYFETVPGAAGNFAPPQPGRSRSRIKGSGEAAARLAADTDWSPTRVAGSARSSIARPDRTDPTLYPAGSSPTTAIARTLAGSDEGGSGIGLPVLLAGALAGALAVVRGRSWRLRHVLRRPH